MKATFKGIPNEPDVESVYMYGQTFRKGEAVEVTDPTARRKLANHAHFDAEVSDEDRKIDEQVKRDFAAAATAGLMEAQADAIRRQAATAPAEPPPTPQEPPAPPALKSATDYQQRVEMGGGLPPQLSEAELRAQLAQREEQAAQAKETSDGNAERAGDADSSADQGRRTPADAGRGRTGGRR